MPFNERVRQWTLEIADGKCQTMIYTEKHGYQICGRDAVEIDHSPPESYVLYHGGDPNNDSTPIPRCIAHHRGQGLTRENDGSIDIAGYGELEWSRHPDIGQALEEYRKGDKDAFKKATAKHIEAVENGWEFTGTDWQIDEYEKEHMDYLAQNGKPRPFVKRRKQYAGKGTT